MVNLRPMMKRVVPWVLKLSLSGGLIWYVLSKQDLEGAWAKARGMDLGMLILAFAVMLLQVVVGAERWRSAIRGIGENLRYGLAFRFQYIGLFFNLALPGMVGGDALRVWKAHKQGMGFASAFNSVMIERLATVLALVLLVTVMQPLLFSRMGASNAVYIFPLLSLAAIGGLAFLMVFDRTPERFRAWRMARGLAHLARDLRAVFLHFRSCSGVLGLAVLGHLNLSVVVFILALGLSMEVTLVDCLVLVPPVILVMTLPISISGWGVRELAMVEAFKVIGVPGGEAVVLSLLFGIVTMVVALPGGIFWVLSKDPSEEVPDLADEAEEVEREEEAGALSDQKASR